jgi:hypothetical protein
MRRLSLRTQLRASYGIYTKGDVAKDNTRTIDIRWEAEQPSGTGAAVGTVTQMRMTISCKTIAGADMLWGSLLSRAGRRAGRLEADTTVLQGELQEGSTSRNLMGDGNMGHMLDASRCGHVRHHVLLDLVETGKNTGDGRNMTQEPGAQENCDSIHQQEICSMSRSSRVYCPSMSGPTSVLGWAHTPP